MTCPTSDELLEIPPFMRRKGTAESTTPTSSVTRPLRPALPMPVRKPRRHRKPNSLCRGLKALGFTPYRIARMDLEVAWMLLRKEIHAKDVGL